jgi:O-antigen/teichoic acid export membrane protein
MNRQFYYIGAVSISAISTSLINLYLARILSLEDFGKISLIISSMWILISLFLFGQSTAISMVFYSDRNKGIKNFSHEFYICLKIIKYSFFFFLPFISLYWFFKYREVVSLYLFILLITASLLYSIQIFLISFINCLDQYKIYFTTTVFGSFSLILIGVLRPTPTGYLEAIIACAVINIIFVYSIIIKSFNVKENNKINYNIFELIKISWVAIPGMFISSASSFSDRFILNNYKSISELAIFALAFTISVNTGRVLITAITKGNSILIMKYLQDNNFKLFINKIKNTENNLCLILLVCAITNYILAEFIVINIFGVKYLEASFHLLTLFLGVMLEGISLFISQVLVQKGKLYILVINSFCYLIISIFLNITLVSSFSIHGIVITFYLICFLSVFVVYYQVRSLINIIPFPIKLTSMTFVFFVIYIYEYYSKFSIR